MVFIRLNDSSNDDAFVERLIQNGISDVIREFGGGTIRYDKAHYFSPNPDPESSPGNEPSQEEPRKPS